jgi:hypothetical protein
VTAYAYLALASPWLLILLYASLPCPAILCFVRHLRRAFLLKIRFVTLLRIMAHGSAVLCCTELGSAVVALADCTAMDDRRLYLNHTISIYISTAIKIAMRSMMRQKHSKDLQLSTFTPLQLLLFDEFQHI